MLKRGSALARMGTASLGGATFGALGGAAFGALGGAAFGAPRATGLTLRAVLFFPGRGGEAPA